MLLFEHPLLGLAHCSRKYKFSFVKYMFYLHFKNVTISFPGFSPPMSQDIWVIHTNYIIFLIQDPVKVAHVIHTAIVIVFSQSFQFELHVLWIGACGNWCKSVHFAMWWYLWYLQFAARLCIKQPYIQYMSLSVAFISTESVCLMQWHQVFSMVQCTVLVFIEIVFYYSKVKVSYF